MSNNNSESEKAGQSSHPVGHGAQLNSIQHVTLLEHVPGSTVSIMFSESNTIELRTDHPVSLGEDAIGVGQPFDITITLDSNSSFVPPATLELDNSGDVILTGNSEDNGWHSKTNLFTIETHDFSAVLIFTGPSSGGIADQEIILVGTVPTPHR